MTQKQNKTLKDCKTELIEALWSCAKSVARTNCMNTALQGAIACEKLSETLSALELVKEDKK